MDPGKAGNAVDLRQFLLVLRHHWVLVVAALVVCTGAAAAYAWTREPVYAAHTQLFVSAKAPSGTSPAELYQGSLASESRAESYARFVSSPRVAQSVVSELGLSRSLQDVQSAITAAVRDDTTLIELEVEDESPELAKEIADAVTTQLQEVVETSESSPAEESPVEVSVPSPAVLPTSPESPPKVLYLGVGALLGLILGVGLAVLRELLDRRIRDDEDTEAIAGAPVLGHIPRGSSAERLVMVDDADSPEAEAYRRLRTNLRVVTIDRGRRSLLVTSAVAGEGRTLLAANLAFAFAQAGHRVVLVDADMRRPGLGRLLGLEPAPGLSELLSGDIPAEPLHSEHELPLEVLTSGSPRPNPSELLESGRFAALLGRLTLRAEIVILDSPALLPVSDASVIARLTAAVLMVVRVSSTRAEQLDDAAELLRAVGKHPVGAVLNGLPARLSREHAYGSNKAVEAPAPAVPVWDA